MPLLYKWLESWEEEIDQIENEILEYQKQNGPLEVGDKVVAYKVQWYAQYENEDKKTTYFNVLPTYYIDQELREYIVIEKIHNKELREKRNMIGQNYLDYLNSLKEEDWWNYLKTKNEFYLEVIDTDICIVDPTTKVKIYTKQKHLCKIYKENKNKQEETDSYSIKDLIAKLINITKVKNKKTLELINALNNWMF